MILKLHVTSRVTRDSHEFVDKRKPMPKWANARNHIMLLSPDLQLLNSPFHSDLPSQLKRSPRNFEILSNMFFCEKTDKNSSNTIPNSKFPSHVKHNSPNSQITHPLVLLLLLRRLLLQRLHLERWRRFGMWAIELPYPYAHTIPELPYPEPSPNVAKYYRKLPTVSLTTVSQSIPYPSPTVSYRIPVCATSPDPIGRSRWDSAPRPGRRSAATVNDNENHKALARLISASSLAYKHLVAYWFIIGKIRMTIEQISLANLSTRDSSK